MTGNTASLMPELLHEVDASQAGQGEGQAVDGITTGLHIVQG